MAPSLSSSSPPIDWVGMTAALRAGHASAFDRMETAFNLDPSSNTEFPFCFALFSNSDEGPLDQVVPFLTACVMQGVALYDPAHPSGHALSNIQDPAKLTWWLEQGGDAGALNRDGKPLWFALIDAARIDLLNVIRQRPQWPRWSRQRSMPRESKFCYARGQWARLAMTSNDASGGENPDLPLEMSYRPDGEEMPIMGSDTRARTARAMGVWAWLQKHLPSSPLDDQHWWHDLWFHGILNEIVVQDVWATLRQEAWLQEPMALHAMDLSWTSFLQNIDNGDWRLNRFRAWGVRVEQERLREASPKVDPASAVVARVRL